MLEKALSRRGYALMFGLFLILFGYVIWHRVHDSGIVRWADGIQAEYFEDGTRYYPKRSVLMLFVPIFAFCTAMGFMHDAIFRLGKYAPKPKKKPRPENDW